VSGEGATQTIVACNDCRAMADALRAAWARGDEQEVGVIELAIDTHLTGPAHDR
jgi:hypothetical protein